MLQNQTQQPEVKTGSLTELFNGEVQAEASTDLVKGQITHWENNPDTGEFTMKGVLCLEDGKPSYWLSPKNNVMVAQKKEVIALAGKNKQGKATNVPAKATIQVML